MNLSNSSTRWSTLSIEDPMDTGKSLLLQQFLNPSLFGYQADDLDTTPISLSLRAGPS
jgi:hypothetical protein